MISNFAPGTERTDGGGGDGIRKHPLSHVMPLKTLIAVWVALAVLTGVTVGVTRVDLGGLALWVAMAIATLKASLVALYFMHLRYDRPVNLIIFLGTLLFVFLFVGMALMDTQSYQPDLIPGYAPAMPQ
jgi:cytochrome c oxidase subunit IV